MTGWEEVSIELCYHAVLEAKGAMGGVPDEYPAGNAWQGVVLAGVSPEWRLEAKKRFGRPCIWWADYEWDGWLCEKCLKERIDEIQKFEIDRMRELIEKIKVFKAEQR